MLRQWLKCRQSLVVKMTVPSSHALVARPTSLGTAHPNRKFENTVPFHSSVHGNAKAYLPSSAKERKRNKCCIRNDDWHSKWKIIMVAVDLDAALDEALGEAWTNAAQQALAQQLPRRVPRKKVVQHRTSCRTKRRSSSLPPPRTTTSAASSRYKKRGLSSRAAAATSSTAVLPLSPPLTTIEEGDAETATLQSMASSSRRGSLNDAHSCGGGSWCSSSGGGADSCLLRLEARFGSQYYDPEDGHFLDEMADRRLVDLLASATAVDLDDSSESSTSETDCNSDENDGTIVVEQSKQSPPSQQPQSTWQNSNDRDHSKRARSAFQRRHRAQLCLALATLVILGGAIGTRDLGWIC
jgi:hypothetical protein